MENAQLLQATLVALLMMLGSSFALLGLLAGGDPTRASRPWAWAWAALFVMGALVLLDPRELHPGTAAVMGLPPFLFLAGSLLFVGRPLAPWVIALVPVGGLLRVAALLLGPVAAPVWAGVVLAAEGSATMILQRGSRPESRVPERLLPFAMGLTAITHAAGALLYAEQGMSRTLTLLTLVAIACLLPLQILAILDRSREESERLERAHRESESRFQSLADLSNLVVLILDTENRVVEWNQTAEAIYGWKREDALGRDYLETFLPEEVRAPITAEISRILAGGQTHGYENPVRTREGERILR